MTPSELVIAFAMWCDENNLCHDDGVAAAEQLADELFEVAEDRNA